MTVSTTTLVLGATGATGSLLVRQLIEKNQNVKAVVRSKEKLITECLGDFAYDSSKLTVVEGTILEMSDDELKDILRGCDAAVSCLGHNLTMQGVYKDSHTLVRDSIARICNAVQQLNLNLAKSTKFILMGSDGVANPDGSDDARSCGERSVLSCIRLVLPPHVDNEAAAAYLYDSIGKEASKVEWVIVRPSDLIDAEVSEYEVVPKPTGSLFGGIGTSRANVAAFMCELLLHEESWKKWLFQSPVVLNVNPESVS